MLTNRFTLLALPLSVASLALASCGGGGDDATASGGDSRAEMREAALDYAQCMREHGVDMPDPKFSENGGMTMRIGGPGSRKAPPKATMDAAQKACQKIMERVKPPTMSPQQQAEARERALKMARCMRERGFDFPDPQFGKGGEIRRRIGGPNSGIDPEDPRFQQAMEACQKSSGGGPGGPMLQGRAG
jgi:hypothetical protein